MQTCKTKKPFITIVTVAYNDVWAIVKTARSAFSQSFKEFEYIIVDGESDDGVAELATFWKTEGLLDNIIIEPDNCVYDAMNKGIRAATGEFVCFMNAGDIFFDTTILERVAIFLKSHEVDGCLGWGSLNGQIWASWSESEAFKMASLGFCHQALYVRRTKLLKCLFDDRKHKTDSDTLQLGSLYASGANIPILPDVLAIRGGEPGISADFNRTKLSIVETITSEYKFFNSRDAEIILNFRRSCDDADGIINIINRANGIAKEHLARLILDTLFLRQSRKLQENKIIILRDISLEALKVVGEAVAENNYRRLIKAQSKKAVLLKNVRKNLEILNLEINKFSREEDVRIEKLENTAFFKAQKIYDDVIVALTSFPARIQTVHFVIRSLLMQTHRPKEIHLFLGRDEFPNDYNIPSALKAYEGKGLIINFVNKTCHQYDKFLHGAHLNKDHDYIIVDDDVIYPPNALAAILQGRASFPGHIIGNRCHLMPPLCGGKIAPYNEWTREATLGCASFRLVPTGAGGVLYPKGFMSPTFVCNVSDILATAPYADDLWLKACAIAQGISTYATPLSNGSQWYHRYTPTMRAGTLMDVNVGLGLNDFQMELCCSWLDKKRPGWRQYILETVEVR
jgi:glycosyltransferase involved in cell wall biosynthesis